MRKSGGEHSKMHESCDFLQINAQMTALLSHKIPPLPSQHVTIFSDSGSSLKMNQSQCEGIIIDTIFLKLKTGNGSK